MSNGKSTASERAWALIDEEKKRDRFLRKVSRIAWVITFVIVAIFTVMIGIQVAQMIKVVGAGAAPLMAVVGVAIPLVVVLGFLALLIATLSTVGIFLRLRTASLTEIHLRLATLEEMLSTRGEPGA
jgi:cytochrome bd-type quinol oxidase subunit 2